MPIENEAAKEKVKTEVVSLAQVVEHADVVAHSDNVENVEIHGEAVRTAKSRKLDTVSEIARSLVTFFALCVMVVVIVDKNRDEDQLKQQLKEFQLRNEAGDALVKAKEECQRRFQDKIDNHTEQQLVLIGEFLVIITLIPPGDEREDAALTKIKELDRVNISARAAATAKTEYNNAGSPLPCPLEKFEPPAPLSSPVSSILRPITIP